MRVGVQQSCRAKIRWSSFVAVPWSKSRTLQFVAVPVTHCISAADPAPVRAEFEFDLDPEGSPSTSCVSQM